MTFFHSGVGTRRDYLLAVHCQIFVFYTFGADKNTIYKVRNDCSL